MEYDSPSAGDYAWAAAQSASRDAAEALSRERSNTERIEALALRQTVLETILHKKDRVDEVIAALEEKRRQDELKVQYIGGVEIPEGWEPTVEGRQVVFRKKVSDE